MKKIIISSILLILSFTTLEATPKTGLASHYSTSTNGTRTASGIPLCDRKLTAASCVFPLHSLVKITNLNNKKSVVVKITDTGPFAIKNGKAIKPLKPHPTRIIDVSKATAKALGFYKNGIVRVEVKKVGPK